MIRERASFGWCSARLVRVVLVWWLCTLVFSWLMIQPLEGFLRSQADTARIPALDPFVLLVTLQRQQPLVSAAVGVTLVLLVANKLCLLIPYTWTLVVLSHNGGARAATMLHTLRALPGVALISLVAEGIPVIALYALRYLTGGFGWLLASTPVTLVVVSLLLVTVVGVWVYCLTWFDLSRITLVGMPDGGSLKRALSLAANLLARAPARLLLQSVALRLVTWLGLMASGVCSGKLVTTDDTVTRCLSWLVAQLLLFLVLWVRVVWLATATRYSLRPPSRNS